MIGLPRSPAARGVLLAAALVATVNLVVVVVDALAPTPSGRPSSALATAPQGFAAWAELARQSGIRVDIVRDRPHARALPRSGTVVVLDPDRLSPPEQDALRRFLQRGGRLVAGGPRPQAWLRGVAGAGAPRWAPAGPRAARPVASAPETAGVREVQTAGAGRWRDERGALPLVAGGREGSLVAIRTVGRGRLVLVADSSPLQNRRLARADNAALALGLAGPGPLAFVEGVHGYGRASGWAALPLRVRWALGLALLAAVVLMVARGRRFGPPLADRRELPPPRHAYVEALGTVLARARRPEAAEPVRRAAVEKLAARAGVDPRRADPARLAAAARAAGVSEEEAAALRETPHDERSVVLVGRAHATLSAGAARASEEER